MNFVRIDGFPAYVIHPCGTILRICKDKTTQLKHYKNQYGYMQVVLYNNGKQKQFLVHRLLGIAFIPNPENKPQIDHGNGVKDDNSLDNLSWVTQSENMAGFRSNRPKAITKGGIYKTEYGWIWHFYIDGIKKTKTMKSKEKLEKFRKEKLSLY